MLRLIDVDELLKTSFRILGKIGDKYPFEAIAISEIEAAPTVDAVPVVRCKDCAYIVWTAVNEMKRGGL